jgi:ribosomal protein S18 acetylase RimI-like enzyme
VLPISSEKIWKSALGESKLTEEAKMLIELSAKLAKRLSNELEALSESDKKYFHPHKFDVESIKNLSKEKGNHYYIYQDNLGDFAGYGMLRTFGQYEIPTLGCVIWERYRRRGNGKGLVKELIEKAQELGYCRIRLKVYSDNKTAYELYRRIGFMSIGKNENEQICMEHNCEKGRVK